MNNILNLLSIFLVEVLFLLEKQDKGLLPMLQIKKAAGKKEQWIVYNPHNFKYHTHCYSLRAARLLRDNINHKREPRTVNIRLLESHMRLTADKKYKALIQQRIDNINIPPRGLR